MALSITHDSFTPTPFPSPSVSDTRSRLRLLEANAVGVTTGRSVPRLLLMLAIMATCLTGAWSLASTVVHAASNAAAVVVDSGPHFDAATISVPSDQLPTRTVRPGDTLWSIAVDLHMDKDVRQVVADIQEINGGDVVLQPGEMLLLPAYATR